MCMQGLDRRSMWLLVHCEVLQAPWIYTMPFPAKVFYHPIYDVTNTPYDVTNTRH